MNETITQPVVKPKRQLTEAQKAALKKGREALAAKRHAALQESMTELVEETQKDEVNELIQGLPPKETESDDELVISDTSVIICTQLAIIVASYFMMFIVCQQL